MDKPRLSPRARALAHRIDVLFVGLLLPAGERKSFTAKLQRLLDEGDDNGYASSGRLVLPLEYQSRVYGLVARPDADPSVRSDRLDLFGIILAGYLEVSPAERRHVWQDVIRTYPAPHPTVVPVQAHQSGHSSVLPL